MVKKRNGACKRIPSLLSLDIDLYRDGETFGTFVSDQSLNSMEVMETLEEPKGTRKYRKEILKRVRECNQLARENVSLKMQVMKLQRKHRQINKGNHHAAARLRLLLERITKLEGQLAQFKSTNGTYREVTPHPKEVLEYSEKHSGTIRSARELGASAPERSDTKLLPKKLRRAVVDTTGQSSRSGQSRAQSSETEDFPQRVEVRCLHESPSVLRIRSPSLLSRLSRVCENRSCQDEREHWEPRPMFGAERGVEEYSSSELLREEKKTLERERELLRLDRLRLEQERRQIQLQRHKWEIIDAQTASVKQRRSHPSSTTRYRDESPYYCSVHCGNTCDEFTSHGNIAGGGFRRSHDPSSDFIEGSNKYMNRLHGTHVEDYYCIESPSSCCYDFCATYDKRETPLFGTSRSAYTLPPGC
ncbi:hypothetical protein GCK32_012372 [Trichostrongylus colubriformis]|uniref:Uncharacterized protein n=1 Tax=Trichostrongylus colubriformis TaxID=6319 RepID=A0AAN8FIB5_TRICO